jgi:hypothetical protein
VHDEFTGDRVHSCGDPSQYPYDAVFQGVPDEERAVAAGLLA